MSEIEDEPILTKKERLAINRLKRAIKNLPDSIKVYGIDRTLSVCKQRVSSSVYYEDVGDYCGSGCYLSDLHDNEF